MAYQVTVAESIARVLRTPLGSRVMLPDYGSRLHEYIDRRPDATWKLDVITEAYRAINTWEPRVKVSKIAPGQVAERMTLEIYYTNTETGESDVLEILL